MSYIRKYTAVTVLALGLVHASFASDGFLSLDAAISHALEANYKHLNLIDSVELAGLDYENARSVYKTKFHATSSSDARSGADVGSRYGVYLKKKNLSGSALSAGVYNSSFDDKSLSELRFTYTLPFFRNPMDDGRVGIHRSENELLKRERMLEIAQQELSNQVTGAYYRLILAMDRVALAGVQREITGKIHEATVIRHGGGEISDMELGHAELRAASAVQATDLVEFQRQLAQDNLKLLIGMDVTTPVTVDPAAPLAVNDSILGQPVEILEDIAVEQRTELVGKREEIALSRRRVQGLSEKKLPDIDIDLHYALIGEGNDFDDSFSVDDQRWGVGVKMDTDFGGTERKTRQRRLYLQYQAQHRELDHLTQQIRIDVRTAHFEVSRNQRLLQLTTRELQLTEQQFTHAEILHRNDKLNAIELLESEYRLREVEHQQLAAQINLLLAGLELKLASGLQPISWNF